MKTMPKTRKVRVAVISLLLNKTQGSERIINEWLEHLPDEYEIHVYCQRAEDISLSKTAIHRIPKLPGPHLLNFLWWIVAVRLWVGWDRRFRGLQYDLIFCSGADWPGADVVCIHIVFAEYCRRIKSTLYLFRNSLTAWPRVLHRRAYYFAVRLLERRAYTNSKSRLIVHSKKTAEDVERAYGHQSQVSMIRLGIDHTVFTPSRRSELRADARARLGMQDDEFVVLAVGNDWRNKGFPALIEALEKLRGLPISLMIVSREDLSVCKGLVEEKALIGRIRFMPPRKDIESYYAAADAYAGPSLQDSYSMPPVEAMASGMPVIVSAAAGASEIVTDGVDGLILVNPSDAEALAKMIRRLYNEPDFARSLGNKAYETTQKYTWEGNGRELAELFESSLRRKARSSPEVIAQEL